jgi:outer membrane protein TolC
MKLAPLAALILFSVDARAGVQNLSLKQALDLASKQNLDYVSASQNFEQDSINYRNEWRRFYLPNISVSTTASSGLTLGAYPGTPASGSLPTGRNTGYPQSALTFSLGSYTLFNSFKDRIAYDNAKITFQRAGQSLEETRRSIHFRIIAAYFQARLNQEKLETAESSRQIAKTIVGLIRSRVALGQATSTELSSVQVDLNDASLQANLLKADYETSILNLNALLNQTAENQIHLTTPLSYKPIKLNYPQMLAWFKDHAPLIRSLKTSNQIAQGSLEIAEKNRMPLPTLTFSGVNVSYGNRYSGGSTTYTSNGSGVAGAFEVEAAINLTLPILGPGGLFGADTVASSRINLTQSELRLQQGLINGDLQIRSALFQLQQLEDRLKTQVDSRESSAKLLAKVMADMTTQKASRLELRDAIDRERNSNIDYLQNTYSYITQKNGLYELIGKDWDEE